MPGRVPHSGRRRPSPSFGTEVERTRVARRKGPVGGRATEACRRACEGRRRRGRRAGWGRRLPRGEGGQPGLFRGGSHRRHGRSGRRGSSALRSGRRDGERPPSARRPRGGRRERSPIVLNAAGPRAVDAKREHSSRAARVGVGRSRSQGAVATGAVATGAVATGAVATGTADRGRRRGEGEADNPPS